MASEQQAKKTKDIAGHAAKIAVRRTDRDRRVALKDQTFEDLNNKDRDALLKLIAIKLGLIKDSPDS